MSEVYAKPEGITLVGGGELSRFQLERALAVAPYLVAADGGADAALGFGHVPELVVGDFDSLSQSAQDLLGPARLRHVAKQDTTDFDKVLAATSAPVTLAVGFTGARLDHTLAVMSSLVRLPHRRVLVDSGEDICLIAPPEISLELPVGTRLSLYPLSPCNCHSQGLRWETGELRLSPLGIIGTSNEIARPRVTLRPSAPALLLMLPVSALDACLSAVSNAPSWPIDARAQ